MQASSPRPGGPQAPRRWRGVWRAAWWLYLAVLLRITVFRSGAFQGPLFDGRLNLSLFVAYLPLLSAGKWGRCAYLFFGNIVCFVPFGAGLARRFPRLRIPGLLLCGLGFSLAIEVSQFVLGTGVSELDDLVLNAAGTALGGLLARRFFADA